MKVINYGKKPKEEDVETFTCDNCGCVFECAIDEYWVEPVGLSCYANCPTCYKVCLKTSSAKQKKKIVFGTKE